MQPLFVPEWKYDSISMGFVGALSKTVKGSDSIWMIVDRLTKSAHFIPIKTGMSMARLAEIYSEHIIRLHGIKQKKSPTRHELKKVNKNNTYENFGGLTIECHIG